MRATIRRQGISVTILAMTACGFTAVGCGGGPATTLGEAGPESGTPDAAVDHASHDAGTEARVDARHDSGVEDAPAESAPDSTDAATGDVALDAPMDVSMDAPVDASGDASADARSKDAPSEVGPADAPTESALDSGPVSCVTNDTACATPPGGECCGNVCVPGNCCLDSDCTTGSAIACQSNTCTACDAVASGAYFVDPVNGSDSTNSTGSDSAGGTTAGICAFKTIGHALSVLGATPAAGTTITVLGNVSHTLNGEVFPLAIPTNTIVQGSSASVTISVAGATTDGGTTGSDGFDLSATASGLSSLIVDGSGATAGSRGVVVDTGSSSKTTLSDVTIKSFPSDGIVVLDAGVLTVGPGTSSKGNLNGLHVTGTASASVSGSSGSPTSFDSNGSGILVDSTASISIVGTPGTGGAGTVVAKDDGVGGADAVVFQPTPSGTGSFPTMSLVNGLVVWGSKNNAMHIYGGASVKVRNSTLLHSGLSGIRVDANVGCTGVPISCTSNTYTSVDLGNATGADWGLNTVQDVTTGNPNKTAGICFAPSPPSLASTLSLLANGNIFGTVNCSTTAGTLTLATDCSSTTSLDVGLPSSTGISISTNMCTN